MTLLDVSIVNVALPSIAGGPARAAERAAVDRLRLRAHASGCCSCRPGASATRAGGGRCSCSASRCSCSPARPAGSRRRRRARRSPRLLQGFAGGLITPQISGPHPEPVPAAGARQGVRLLRHDRRRLDRDRPADRRRADRAVRRPRRLAGGVLRQPADRRRSRCCSPAATCRRRRREQREPSSLDPLGVVLLGARGRVHPRAVHRAAHVGQPAAARAVPGRRACCSSRGCCTSAATARTREPLVSLDLFPIRVVRARRGRRRSSTSPGSPASFFILTQYLQLGLDYPALEGRPGRDAVRDRRGADRVGRQPPRARPRAQARRVRARHRDRRASPASGSRSGPSPATTSRSGPALPLLHRRPRRRPRDLAQPDALALAEVPVQRAGSAGGVLQTGQRIGSAAGHRGHRQRLLHPARRSTRRLRVRVPARADQHRRVRRRRARARTR